jgi:hypothetical protein
LFISIRIAPSCAQPLQLRSGPRGERISRKGADLRLDRPQDRLIIDEDRGVRELRREQPIRTWTIDAAGA